MNQTLKQISCDPICGFMVRSHDSDELIDIAMAHAKSSHKDIKVSEGELKKMIKKA